MKKINLCPVALVFFAFIFLLDSYSANASLGLGITQASIVSKNKISYNSINDNEILMNSTKIFVTCGRIPNELFLSYPATNSLERNMPYLTKTGIDIDPDWLKFVTHFTCSIEGSDQKD
ncbi:hypothetical protein [Flavobacterium sp. N3904]|uniref:hypothetical protein n=1 Tax=Flavobacterium sp. N3904 TaxID=2986835 RepID=UPI002224C48B|nr:hypothetical protein [Flavobacterium sp. N3904]